MFIAKQEHFDLTSVRIGDCLVLLVADLMIKAVVFNCHRKRLFVKVDNELIAVPRHNNFLYHGQPATLLKILYPKVGERKQLKKELNVIINKVNSVNLSEHMQNARCVARAV